VSYPVEREITEQAEFTGRFEAVYSVDVRARVTGYLDEVYFKDGDEVTRGAPLFEIDPRPYKVDLDRAEGSAAQIEARLARLDAERRRGVTLFNRGASSREEFDRSTGDYKEAQASLSVARANLDMAKLNIEFTKVRAPIGGLLSRRLVDPGNLVQADVTPLTSIVSLDPIYLYFDIDERTVLKVRSLVSEGKLVSREQGAVVPIMAALAGEEGFPHKGVINFSDNKINPRTGTLRVRGVIENPVVKGKNFRQLSPGLFARVRLPLGEPHRALLVTERAIDTDQGQKILYLVDDKNEVDSRPVRLGAIHDGLRAIEDGLKPGERVIVVGLQQVRPGAVVEPKLVDMPVSLPRRTAALGVGADGPGLTGGGLVRAVR
jgi:RND family efflux transporter MFP subunit